MNLNITQENLYLLLPSKMSWLATMLADDKGISIVEAIKILYTSSFYTRLADESKSYGISVPSLCTRNIWQTISEYSCVI